MILDCTEFIDIDMLAQATWNEMVATTYFTGLTETWTYQLKRDAKNCLAYCKTRYPKIQGAGNTY